MLSYKDSFIAIGVACGKMQKNSRLASAALDVVKPINLRRKKTY
jgi:hypothetical protein